MHGWLIEPVTVRRRGMLVVAAVVGLACAGAILYSYNAATTAADEAVARKQDRVRTDAQIAKIARRIVKLETPTAAEIERRVRRDLKLCLRERRCLRTIRKAGAQGLFNAQPVTPGGGAPAGGSPGSGAPGGGGGNQPTRRHPPNRGPSPAPSPAPAPAPVPRPPSGPSRPNLTAPLPVQVCTMLVGVNCP